MWYAEKLELIKNPKDDWDDESDGDCTIEVNGEIIHFKTGSSGLGNYFTVKINGETISNHNLDGYELCTKFNYQSSICVCGTEGCNIGGWLLIRRHEKSIFILPAFDTLESVAEFNMKKNEDMSPPDKWYEEGVLAIEEPFISEMKSLGLLFFDEIPEMSEQELNMMLEWESMVKNKEFTILNKGYSLFLDDIRTVDMVYPTIDSDFVFVIKRSYDECIAYINENGLPAFMTFDNDLGEDENGNLLPDGYAVAKWLVYESGLDLTYFEFNVHSANPVAKDQIEGLLNNYIKFISEKV